ncbi:MAG: TspO/MBR family protein, partial [Eubacteriales bacterium]
MKKFFLALLITEGTGAVAGLLSKDTQNMYGNYLKPEFSPPDWLFGPVWILLYFLMAVSLYRIWTNIFDSKLKKTAQRFFYFQLILNFVWPILFFRFDLKGPALLELLILELLVIATGLLYLKLDKIAGLLFIPYTLWTGFAIALNY